MLIADTPAALIVQQVKRDVLAFRRGVNADGNATSPNNRMPVPAGGMNLHEHGTCERNTSLGGA